jgi:hypothetical protein
MKASGRQCQCKAEMSPGLQSRDVPCAKEYLHWLVLEGFTSDLKLPKTIERQNVKWEI